MQKTLKYFQLLGTMKHIQSMCKYIRWLLFLFLIVKIILILIHDKMNFVDSPRTMWQMNSMKIGFMKLWQTFGFLTGGFQNQPGKLYFTGAIIQFLLGKGLES